ncbi:unnamed protein product [Paramecium octaurelia]|uniref:Uncharacterized protein n=1 Tax=Paramecium octaurelia TaxID=43137 RepID=A0A8S1U0B5_PAROT|nr:unnamed protein product [Paramecium octaurelia]
MKTIVLFDQNQRDYSNEIRTFHQLISNWLNIQVLFDYSENQAKPGQASPRRTKM